MKVWVILWGKPPKLVKVIAVDEENLKRWVLVVALQRQGLLTIQTPSSRRGAWKIMEELLPKPARNASVWHKGCSYRNALLRTPSRTGCRKYSWRSPSWGVLHTTTAFTVRSCFPTAAPCHWLSTVRVLALAHSWIWDSFDKQLGSRTPYQLGPTLEPHYSLSLLLLSPPFFLLTCHRCQAYSPDRGSPCILPAPAS